MDCGWHGVNYRSSIKIKRFKNMINYNKEQVGAKIIEVKKQFMQMMLRLQERPILLFALVGLFFIFLFMIFFSSDSAQVQKHPLQESSVPFRSDGKAMVGVKESIDPRDVWTAKVEQRVQATRDELVKQVEAKKQESDTEIVKIKDELLLLQQSMKKQQEELERRQLEESLRLSNNKLIDKSPSAPVAVPKSMGFFTKDYGHKKRNVKEYITSGSFARGVLLTGVVVGTGSNASSNPEPLMIRLTDAGRFSKGLLTEQIKEAILIGDCSGDLASERARCRLQTLSLENMKGEIIERSVQGWIVGEDGRNGVKGIVVDKSSDMLRMAMLNGVLGGMSKFFQGQATKGIFPVSPITGGQNALSSISTLKGGVATGAGDAFGKMADFVMERFNSMSPQIVIASGREVDVVFRKGVDLNGVFEEESQESRDGNLKLANGYDQPEQAENYNKHGSEAFNEAMSQMNNGIRQRGQNEGF